MFMNPAASKATKCDQCGGEPACAVVCPTDCITYTDTDGNGAWIGAFAQRVTQAHQEAYG